MEIWRDIPGYEGLYQVSNFGQVKSLPKRKGRGFGYATSEKILRHSVNSRGYCNIVLCKNGKTETFAIHRLVAENFIDNSLGLPEVDHQDRDKTNNHVGNLRWVTRLENNLNRQNGFPVVCVETGIVYDNAATAGKENGLAATSILACCKNRPHHHTCGGYHWRYHEKIA